MIKPLPEVPTSEQSFEALLDALSLQLNDKDYPEGFGHHCGELRKVQDVLIKFFSELNDEKSKNVLKVNCKEGSLLNSWECSYNMVWLLEESAEFLDNRSFNFNLNKSSGKLVKGSLICGLSY